MAYLRKSSLERTNYNVAVDSQFSELNRLDELPKSPSIEKHSKSSKEDRKRKRKEKPQKSHAVTEWGKYGIIQECDIRSKQPEFNLWLLEVKNLNFETIPSWSEKNLFREFMEDFNTATFPNKKYYDLEKWEKKHVRRLNKKKRGATNDLVFDDEKKREAELAQLRKAQKKKEIQSKLQNIREDSEKLEAMRHQKMLRAQMGTLFRMGCIKEAQSLQDRLTDCNKPNFIPSFEEEDREVFVSFGY